MTKDRGRSNFPNESWFDNLASGVFGKAQVGKMNGTSFEEKGSFECAGGGSCVTDISIDDFATSNGGNLAIIYSKNYVNDGNAKVYWRYNFGGDGTYLYNTQDNNDGIDVNTKGKLTLEFNNPPKCVVLHIWLYKVLNK